MKTYDDMYAKLSMYSPQTGATPLYIAAENNHADVVGLLLAAGANADLATEVRHYLMLTLYMNTCVHTWELAFRVACIVCATMYCTCIHASI